VRAVHSARSRNLPAWRKYHPSSRGIVESVMPCSSWLKSTIERQKRVVLSARDAARRRRPGRWTSRWKRLSASHISVATWWRIVCALSRARAMHSTIEFPFSSEKIRCAATLSSSPSGPPGGKAECSPTMSRSAAQ
jgi:hypothetical protein